MIKKIVSITLLIFGFYSCNRDENDTAYEQDYRMSSYNMEYTDYQTVYDIENNELVTLTFENDRLIKRQGGILNGTSNTGVSGYYDENVYDTIVYSSNKIIAYTKIIPTQGTSGITPNKKELHLSNGKIISKIYHNSEESLSDNDTIQFEYSGNKIVKTYEEGNNYEKLYYYNVNQNLDSIVTNEYMPNDILRYKTIETFEDYDNAVNPFKSLIIFDDTFKRSLSANNYRRYSILKKDVLTNNIHINWFKNFNLIYDSQGIPIFSIYETN